MIPRLPVNMPLCGIAMMSPNGVTRFCNAIGYRSNRRRHGARLRIDRQKLVETEPLFEEDSRLQQHRLATRFADELQANRPPELIEAARDGHGGTGRERDHGRYCRAAHVVVE